MFLLRFWGNFVSMKWRKEGRRRILILRSAIASTSHLKSSTNSKFQRGPPPLSGTGDSVECSIQFVKESLTECMYYIVVHVRGDWSWIFLRSSCQELDWSKLKLNSAQLCSRVLIFRSISRKVLITSFREDTCYEI